MEILSNDGLTGYDFVLAKDVGDVLYNTYPKFMWMITIQDHNVIIRLGDNINQKAWCYFINRKNIPEGSPEKFKKMCLMAGGELLERLHISRKAKEDGQEVGFFEGTEHRPMFTAAGIKKVKPKAIILPGSY
jgi:hypothetical protein